MGKDIRSEFNKYKFNEESDSEYESYTPRYKKQIRKEQVKWQEEQIKSITKTSLEENIQPANIIKKSGSIDKWMP